MYKASLEKEVWILVNSELLISWIRAQVRMESESTGGESRASVISVEFGEDSEELVTHSHVITDQGRFREWPKGLDMHDKALDLLF